MILSIVFLSILPSILRLYFRRNLKDAIFGLGEDLFVGTEVVALLYITNNILLIPLSIIPCYYILDAFLYKKMGIRIEITHFRFLKTAHLFLDSAISMGLLKIIPLCVGVIIGTYLLLIYPVLKTSPFLLIPFILLCFCYKGVSKNGHNALLDLEVKLLKCLFSKKCKKTHLKTLPNSLIPKCEIFTKLDLEKYPLLKMTQGFRGPIEFETTLKKKPNIIFLFLESFRGANIGSLGSKNGVTPHFDELTKKGILFSQFYANGTSTESALWASFTGMPQIFDRPGNLSESNDKFKNLSEIPLITLADILKKEGYHNLFIDGSCLALENRGHFLKNHGFDEVMGKDELPPLKKDNSSSSWGIHDEHLFTICLEKIRQRKMTPLFTSIFTITNHHPWKVPENYKLNTFENIKDPTYRNFLKTMHYTDHCLHNFIEDLDKEGLLDNSLLFILGDHGMSMNERANSIPGKRTLYEEGVHTPLLIYTKNQIKEPKVITTPCSQIDLLPTVLDLLNIKALNHSVGTSLLRKTKDRTIIFKEPSCLGNSFGIRKGHDKYILNDSESNLFDLTSDPKELSSIKNSDKHSHYKEIINDIASLFTEIDFTSPEVPAPHALKTFQGKNSLISDLELNLLTKNYPNLEILNLAYCHLISDKGFQIISEKLPRLKSINLSYNDEITGHYLSTNKVDWVIGEFSGCRRISDKGLHNITHIATSLKNLTLSCKSLTENGIAHALSSLPKLTTLKLTNCNQLKDSSLTCFKSTTINNITLNHATGITNKSLISFKDQPLYCLEIEGANQITDIGLLAIQHLPLNKLVLIDADLSDNAIPALQSLPLQALALSSCSKFTKKGLEKLIDLNLDLLVLKNCNPALRLYLKELSNNRIAKKELYISF